jgi:hypothetical protein
MDRPSATRVGRALAVAAIASLAACGPNWDALDPSLGNTSVTSTSTSTSGSMGSSSGAPTCGGRVCEAGESCVAGACVCAGEVCGGACVSTMTSPTNCGACGHACDATQACSGGTCTCRPGLSPCGTTCVDLQSDPQNCGRCGSACQACTAGMCGRHCSGQTTTCGGGACLTFTQLRSDPLNCGRCGNACAADQVCANGACVAYAPPPGCTTCPCAGCASGTTCCMITGLGFPACVEGRACP